MEEKKKKKRTVVYLTSADRGSILSAFKCCMTGRHFKGSISASWNTE